MYTTVTKLIILLVSIKLIKSKDDNVTKEMFLEQQISIAEWF